jgi:hypothetical protein
MVSVALGEARAKGLDQRRRERAAHAGRQADGQQARGGAALLFQVLPRALHLLQDAACMRQQPLAGFGERDAAAVAVEQGLAQVHFQRPHLAAERGLRHPQHAGGAREAAQFGHLHKGLELLEVHAGDCAGRAAGHAGSAYQLV